MALSLRHHPFQIYYDPAGRPAIFSRDCFDEHPDIMRFLI